MSGHPLHLVTQPPNRHLCTNKPTSKAFGRNVKQAASYHPPILGEYNLKGVELQTSNADKSPSVFGKLRALGADDCEARFALREEGPVVLVPGVEIWAEEGHPGAQDIAANAVFAEA